MANVPIKIKGKTTAAWASGDALLGRQLGLNTETFELRVRAADGAYSTAQRIGLPYQNSMPGSPTHNEALTALGIKNYITAQLGVLAARGKVLVASTANVDVTSAPSTLDGVTLTNGDRVLLKNQSTASENGVYVFLVAGSPFSRANDAATWDNISTLLVTVDQGTTNADTVWFCTANSGGTLGTDPITYVQFGTGSGVYTADEDTLQLVGGEFSLKDTTLLALRTASADGVSLAQAANYAAMRALLDLEAGTDVQAYSAHLAAIAGLTPSADDLLQYKSGAWTNRTPAQVRTDLGVYADTTPLNLITPAAADVDLNSQRIRQLAAPTDAADAANKAYVDGVMEGVDWKDNVRVATTANITMSGTQTIDGVAVVAGNRVLVKDQSTASENGIYVVAAGAWSRASDANTGLELELAVVRVREGTANGLKEYRCSSYDITLGTTAITWVLWNPGTTYTADETTLTQSGAVFSVKALGVGASQLASKAVTLAKLDDLAEARFLMRAAGSGTGTPIAGTPAQLRVAAELDKRTTFSNAAYNVLSTDRYVAQTGTLTASRTVTLPAANSVNAGQEIIVADESGTVTSTNTLVIQAGGSDTINGAASITMSGPYGWRRLVSDGVSKWFQDAGVLRSSSNLLDVGNRETARNNLGVQVIKLSSNYSNSGTGVENVTGLSFDIAAGETVQVIIAGTWRANNATNNPRFGFRFTSGDGTVSFMGARMATTGPTYNSLGGSGTTSASVSGAATSTANADMSFALNATFTASSTGSVSFTIEVPANTTTIKAPTTMTVLR